MVYQSKIWQFQELSSLFFGIRWHSVDRKIHVPETAVLTAEPLTTQKNHQNCDHV